MIGDEQWLAEDEALKREMAARAEKLRHDELLRWCHERAAARTNTVSKRHARASSDYIPNAAEASATLTADWQRYIRQQIQKSANSVIEDMAAAIKETIGKDIVALEKRCAALEAALAELTREMKTRDALSEVTERLRALEARTPPPMKVVSHV